MRNNFSDQAGSLADFAGDDLIARKAVAIPKILTLLGLLSGPWARMS